MWCEVREREKNKDKEGERVSPERKEFRPQSLPHSSLFFSAHISLRRPHNLNSWNRSLHFSIGGNDVSQGHLKSFLGASEMLAMEMKASGMYVSRGLSFRQAEVMHNFRNGIVIFCCKQKFFYHTEI